MGLITIGFFICHGKKPSTPWSSRAVPQPSTDLALHRLAMEFEWDPAFSMQYGRRLIVNVYKSKGQSQKPDSYLPIGFSLESK